MTVGLCLLMVVAWEGGLETSHDSCLVFAFLTPRGLHGCQATLLESNLS